MLAHLSTGLNLPATRPDSPGRSHRELLHLFIRLGYLFLPDHFQLILKPTGDSNFSQIMHRLKPNFARAYKRAIGLAGPLKFCQTRFWNHLIRNEVDFRRDLDYIHYNPVRQGQMTRSEDWPHSSFIDWQRRGAQPTITTKP